MNEAQLLDQLVAPFDGRGDWDEVLRRARRSQPRRRLLLAAAVAVAAFGVAPALAVLLRDSPPRLPKAAEHNHIVVIVQPLTGRMLVMAAPWKDHDGICYLLFAKRAGCVQRTATGSLFFSPPVAGYTFDRRVVAAEAVLTSGKHLSLRVEHFPKLHVTFVAQRDRLPRDVRAVLLRDAHGSIVGRERVRSY